MSNEIFRDDIARKIYENAIVSIQLGVEDYLQANELHREQRLISSVRNLYAGVLLLFKSYLAEESCDSGYSLLKRDVEPRVVDGKTIWIGKGKKTVDFHQIKTNILALGAKCDLQLLEGVRNYRNDIEHYYAKNSKESVEGFVADIFILSTDFMRGALGLSKDEMRHELTDRIWNVLYHSKQVVDKARSRQKAEFDALNWYDGGRMSVELSLCPNCGTAVLQLDNIDNNKNAAQCKFRCRACGDSFEYTELIKQYAKVKNEVVANVPPWIEHTEPPFVDCPNCDEPTFNFFERHCINCDYRDTLECKFCGNQIDQFELPTYFETGHCCHCDYVLNKKD